ncbi:MAG: hypothetical protein ACHREM_14580 [Polyangiales bacterium]
MEHDALTAPDARARLATALPELLEGATEIARIQTKTSSDPKRALIRNNAMRQPCVIAPNPPENRPSKSGKGPIA